MSYQLRHLQHTVHYIVEKLQYDDQRHAYKNLTASDKKRISLDLLVAIDPLQSRNPKNIAINPSNKYLTEFFDMLRESNIIFPESTTYLLKRNGLSYELHDGNRIEIYNRSKLRAEVASRRISELTEQLRQMSTTDDAEDDYELSSDEEGHHYTPHFVSLSDFLPEPRKTNDHNRQQTRAKL